MHLEDRLAPAHIRLIDDNLPIKASGTQQRRVEYIGTVRRRDNDNPLVGRKAVHLHEELIEGLLPLVVPASESCTALTTDCINLINEDNAGRGFLCLIKEIAHARRANTDEHLDKVGTTDGKELHARLACNSLCEQGFSCARRTEEQNPFWYTRTELVEFIRGF